MDKQTERQMELQVDGQINRHTDGQTKTDKQTDGQLQNKRMDRQLGRGTDKWMNRTVRLMERQSVWIGRLKDGQTQKLNKSTAHLELSQLLTSKKKLK